MRSPGNEVGQWQTKAFGSRLGWRRWLFFARFPRWRWPSIGRPPRGLRRIKPHHGGDIAQAIMATTIEERRLRLTRAGAPYPPIPSADDNFGFSQATRHRTNKRRPRAGRRAPARPTGYRGAGEAPARRRARRRTVLFFKRVRTATRNRDRPLAIVTPYVLSQVPS